MIQWPTSIARLFRQLPGDRRLASSASVSFVLHLSVVLACAFWLIPQSSKPQAEIDTAWNDHGAPDVLETVALSVMSQVEEAGGASDGTAFFQFTHSDERSDQMADLDQVSTLDWPVSETIDPATLAGAVSASGNSGRGERARQGVGNGLGASSGEGQGSNSFFGATAEGKRVIYVVDASRSMNHPHPGRMLTRFGRVKLELIRSIGQLTPDQEFFIVYFNERALPMPSNTMVTATPSAMDKFARWAAAFPAEGATNPEEALALALRLRPDVIYFLTDGRFPAKIVRDVTQANRGRVVIHTIGFADDDGEELLRAIAAQNSGDYRFIAAEEDGT